jgi:hypothetical protein
MRSSPTVLRFARSLAAVALVVSVPARGQQPEAMHVSAHVPDSVAHVVERERLAHARFAIVSRDGQAALLLMDTTIIAEMTDTGLASMNSREATDTIKGEANRLFARMALGALQPLFDHGVAYHLRDLADARYADGRLQLLRANGEEVFRETEIGSTPLMESFSPADAREFASRAREAKRRLGR